MKNLSRVLSFCLLFSFISCYDDSKIITDVADLQSRVTELETLCSQMNTNISSLQLIVTALQNNDYVTGVVPIIESDKTIGYTISFTKSSPITIYHGIVGDNGKTPIIGVKMDTDGLYYWTVDGEWLLNSTSSKIKAIGIDGVTPQLKIENGRWFMSIDKGTTWTDMGQATGATGATGEPFLKSISEDSDGVYFTLANGTIITLPKQKSLSITFEESSDIGIVAGGRSTINYTIHGSTAKTIVKALGQNGWNAKVTKQTDSTGYITVTAPNPIFEDEIIVLVYDGDNRTIMSTINFITGVINIATNTYRVPEIAGTLTVPVSTNITYTISIPMSDQLWLSVSRLRAMRTDSITFSYAANQGEERYSIISLIDNAGKTQQTIGIIQEKSYSISEVYNGDLTISTIEDLNNFKNKGYKKIVGDLIINEITSITNLNLLGNTLEEVTGEIEISGKYLTNLSGLDSLRSVGYLTLNGYSGNSFYGLNKLKYIKYDLYLTGVCRPLASFEGLENLTTIGGSLKLSSAMYDFHELRTFKGLDNLETIGKDLNLNSDFCNLESFNGLNKLKVIGGNLNLYKASTTSFISFDKLINFNGLNSLISIGGSFNVLGSFDNLVSFEGLENLESIGGNFFGKGYASGDYSSYNSLKSFKGLTKLKVIKGSISIDNDIRSSFNALASFEGLENVESIGGLFLFGSDGTSFSSLTSFKGLHNIKINTGNISIHCKNSQLTSFSGWDNLQTVGGYISIYMPTIKSLDGLSKLSKIEQYIEINLCEKLSNIDALAGLSSVGVNSFSKHLIISGCSRLFNFCSIAPLLDSFNGSYTLTNNGYNPTQEQIKKGECSGQ